MIDPDRIGQALLALADNAVGHGGGTITLGSAISDGTLSIWVQDNGPGIAPDDMDGIFDRFHRGKGSRERRGSGLGLAIVKSIAVAHGGDVRVDSVLGFGARFTLEIPLEEPEVEREEDELEGDDI
jgi:two-component system, OmpR family, sensor kinase